MSCRECLLMLEAYAYDELAGAALVRLEAHLAGCAACAGEHAELRRERELYARCAVNAPPTIWAAVRARINEKDAARAASPVARVDTWLVGAFGGWLPRPLRAAAAALVLLAVCAGVVRHVAWRRAPADEAEARTGEAGKQTAPSARPAGPTPSGLTGRADARRAARGQQGRAGHVRAADARRAGLKSAARRPAAPGGASPAGASVSGAARVARGSRPAAEFDLDAESARHLEKAQMLLRSFKNGRLSPDEPAALAYERESSRKLLGRNLLLRNDARAEGNELVERLLGQLEPFLLDIANLHESASPEQIHSIREQMRRKGIIASLRLFEGTAASR